MSESLSPFKKMASQHRLQLMPRREYPDVVKEDPLRFYFWPVIGRIYRRRVELCLAQCKGGERILEIGFGCGATFLNLHALYREIHGIDLTSRIDEVAEVFKAKKINTYLKNGNILGMPYSSNYFDTVLIVSVLEHLHPSDLAQAFQEIHRVIRPGGQVVYGVPIERPLMQLLFRLLGYNIREHHFSTEKDVVISASRVLRKVKVVQMDSFLPRLGPIYEVGHFTKENI